MDSSSLNPSMALMDAHARFENEKYSLVRVLHDDLGGLLVGAAMDLGWLTQQTSLAMVVQERLARATALLRSAIDLKRTLVEELQPSLLHNVGLFSALRWHAKRTCEAAGVTYSEAYPAAELDMDTSVRVTAFRLLQDGLDYLLADGSVRNLHIEAKCENTSVNFQLSTDQLGRETALIPTADTLFKTTMYYRALSIDGSFQMSAKPSQCNLEIEIPINLPR